MIAMLKATPLILGLLIFIATLSTFFGSKSLSQPARATIELPVLLEYCSELPNVVCLTGDDEPWKSSHFLLGPPNDRYKDNLRNDTHYLTSWSNAGFTNQFMSHVNMIYLATISDRVPIVAPFAPDHHISPSAGPLPFGEIFNLTELRRSLRLPVLEWSEVKAVAPSLSTDRPAVVEELGCWSTRVQNEPQPVRVQHMLDHLGLDVSYTRVPGRYRHQPHLEVDAHVSFFPLAEMVFPEHPAENPGDKDVMGASPLGAILGPDVHMSCFDTLYYVAAGKVEYEWKTPWCPAWRFVGKHIRFTDSVMELAVGYIRRALKVTTDELPPFITVHARRGDFVHQCWDVPTQCLAPLSAFVQRVKEIQSSLFSKHGVNISEVLITSDEKDPTFWREVEAEGWKHIDHAAERTLDKYGEWYPMVVDAVAQSLGAGFVGSIDSTVSMVSAKRVEDWNHGVTRVVGWGGRE